MLKRNEILLRIIVEGKWMERLIFLYCIHDSSEAKLLLDFLEDRSFLLTWNCLWGRVKASISLPLSLPWQAAPDGPQNTRDTTLSRYISELRSIICVFFTRVHLCAYGVGVQPVESTRLKHACVNFYTARENTFVRADVCVFVVRSKSRFSFRRENERGGDEGKEITGLRVWREKETKPFSGTMKTGSRSGVSIYCFKKWLSMLFPKLSLPSNFIRTMWIHWKLTGKNLC